MVRVLLLIILAYVAVRVLSRLLKGVFEGLGSQPPGSSAGSVGLVRDPVCGTFVLPSKALTSGTGSNTRYFCSEKCRQDYGHGRNTEETRRNSGHGRNTDETRRNSGHGRNTDETRKS